MHNTQKLIITIETPADISEETFSRLCDAALLRMLSASLEQSPVRLHDFPRNMHVTVARPSVEPKSNEPEADEPEADEPETNEPEADAEPICRRLEVIERLVTTLATRALEEGSLRFEDPDQITRDGELLLRILDLLNEVQGD